MGVYLSAGALCFRFFSLNPYKPPCCPLCFFMLAVFQGFLFSTPPTYFFLFVFLQPPLNPSHPLGTPWGLPGQLFPLFPYSFPFTPPAPLEPLGFCLEQSLNFHPSTFLQPPLNPSHPLGTPWGFLGQLFPLFPYSFPFTPPAPLEPLGFCLESFPHFSPHLQLSTKQKGPGNSLGPLPVTCPFPLLSFAEYLLSTAAE